MFCKAIDPIFKISRAIRTPAFSENKNPDYRRSETAVIIFSEIDDGLFSDFSKYLGVPKIGDFVSGVMVTSTRPENYEHDGSSPFFSKMNPKKILVQNEAE